MTATITLPPENAALIAAGVQTIITTATKPTKVKPGDRLLIHAAARRPESKMIGNYLPIIDEDGWHLMEWSSGKSIAPGALTWMDLHPGHIVASCVPRDCVPIVQNSNDWDHGNINHIDRMGDWLGLRTNTDGFSQDCETVSDQLPLGDFTPGRWAWLLDDVKRTTERCPACWGSHVMRLDGWPVSCDVCQERGTCPPIPWRGGPGIRWWEP